MPLNNEPHPIFKNEHNPGQITTQHRGIERARLDVARQGRHPEFGQFERDWNAELILGKTTTTAPGTPVVLGDKAFPQEPGVWPERHYKAPSGAKVVVRVEPRDDITKVPQPSPKTEFDRKAEVDGVTYPKPAAERFLVDRYGISI